MEKVVLEWTQLAQILDHKREGGARIVSTNGVFDLLHVGHVRYLQASRALGDILVVAINGDESARTLKGVHRPFTAELERAEILAALECVDYVTLFHELTPEAVLEYIRPTIHVKGGDYEVDALAETETVMRFGGKVMTLPYTPNRSTTRVLNLISHCEHLQE